MTAQPEGAPPGPAEPGAREGNVMAISGSTLAVIAIPIIVALSLFVWIALVTRADRHPGDDRRDARTDLPRTDLSERAPRGGDDSGG